ncbi:MAG TPA: carbohydrate kinase family protein [Thermoanaerobaculia bacterium]|jgi:sugar/nucleoside kinase (ribokinase family)|nr:carbohydrate kinase family protein [Thermoanaerobaculia bacterium]
MTRIVVVGNVSCDRLLLVEELPRPNCDVVVRQTALLDGGAAANVAAAIAANGGQVGLASAVGRDAWGRRLLRNLRTAGVDTRFCGLSTRATTEFVVAMAVNGDRTFYVDLAGASFSYDASPVYEQLGATDAVAFVGCRFDTVRVHAHAMAQAGVQLYAALGFWIASGELANVDPKFSQVLRGCFLNKDEWAALPSTWRDTLLDPTYLAGGRFVVVTGGAASTTVFAAAGEMIEHPLPIRRVVNTLGCGDGFMGAFLAENVKGHSLSRCVRRGHSFARRIAGRAAERF